MGTRADFYVGRGLKAEWIGSIAWDGYPDGIDEVVFSAESEDEYRKEVAQFLIREDGTLPSMGWPWPWENSNTTDYSYAYELTDAGPIVFGTCFGHTWWKVDLAGERYGEPDDDSLPKDCIFPDMTSTAANPNVGSKRSGIIAVSLDGVA